MKSTTAPFHTPCTRTQGEMLDVLHTRFQTEGWVGNLGARDLNDLLRYCSARGEDATRWQDLTPETQDGIIFTVQKVTELLAELSEMTTRAAFERKELDSYINAQTKRLKKIANDSAKRTTKLQAKTK